MLFFTHPVFVASLLPTGNLWPAVNITNLWICKMWLFLLLATWKHKKNWNVSALAKLTAHWLLQDWQTVCSRALLETPHCAVHITKCPIIQRTSQNNSLCSAHNKTPQCAAHIMKHPIRQCTSQKTPQYAAHIIKHLIMQCTTQKTPLRSTHHGTFHYAVHITKHPIMQCTPWNIPLRSAHHKTPHYAAHITKLIIQCTSQNTPLCSEHHKTFQYAAHITKHPSMQRTLWNTSLCRFLDMVGSCKYNESSPVDSQQGVILQLVGLVRSQQLTLKVQHIRNCYTLLYHTFLLNQRSCWMARGCHSTKHLTIRGYSRAEIPSVPHILELCIICSWVVNFVLLQANSLNGLSKTRQTTCMARQELLLCWATSGVTAADSYIVTEPTGSARRPVVLTAVLLGI
jgi:hypothetical protein